MSQMIGYSFMKKKKDSQNLCTSYCELDVGKIEILTDTWLFSQSPVCIAHATSMQRPTAKVVALT